MGYRNTEGEKAISKFLGPFRGERRIDVPSTMNNEFRRFFGTSQVKGHPLLRVGNPPDPELSSKPGHVTLGDLLNRGGGNSLLTHKRKGLPSNPDE